MFGFLYAACTAIGCVISGTKAAIENQQCKNRGIEKRNRGENFTNTYTDRLGATRDIDTNKLVMIDYRGNESEGKDQYLRDMYGRPTRNLSEERRQARLAEAKGNPDPRRTVVEWKKGVDATRAGMPGFPLYAGDTYKDLKNGKIYICRMFGFPDEIQPRGYGVFYMDINTGLLVREADSQQYDRKNGHYEFSEEVNHKFIEYFNNKQQAEGYQCRSNIPRIGGWDTKESERDYARRMENYYCNNKSTYDMPWQPL